jgi:RimJ/RimL family protein N-acetyltransferase
MKILETKRLILRTWQQSDLEPMTKINLDPKVMEYFPSTFKKQETIAFINKINSHYDKHGFTLYAVEIKETQQFIGFVGLLNTNFDAHFTPATEIGWRLGSEFWGKGYATEAAKAVLDYAINELNIDEVVSFTSAINKASIRVMEKIGLHYNPKDNFDSPNVKNHSKLVKHVLYRLKKEDYKG